MSTTLNKEQLRRVAPDAITFTVRTRATRNGSSNRAMATFQTNRAYVHVHARVLEHVQSQSKQLRIHAVTNLANKLIQHYMQSNKTYM